MVCFVTHITYYQCVFHIFADEKREVAGAVGHLANTGVFKRNRSERYRLFCMCILDSDGKTDALRQTGCHDKKKQGRKNDMFAENVQGVNLRIKVKITIAGE